MSKHISTNPLGIVSSGVALHRHPQMPHTLALCVNTTKCQKLVILHANVWGIDKPFCFGYTANRNFNLHVNVTTHLCEHHIKIVLFSTMWPFTGIMSLASLLAATACTDITRTAIVFVHISFINSFIKVLQPDKSLFKYHSNDSKHKFKCYNSSKNRIKYKKKQLGQFYCKLVLKLQKRNNFSVIPIMI